MMLAREAGVSKRTVYGVINGYAVLVSKPLASPPKSPQKEKSNKALRIIQRINQLGLASSRSYLLRANLR